MIPCRRAANVASSRRHSLPSTRSAAPASSPKNADRASGVTSLHTRPSTMSRSSIKRSLRHPPPRTSDSVHPVANDCRTSSTVSRLRQVGRGLLRTKIGNTCDAVLDPAPPAGFATDSIQIDSPIA